MYEVTFNSVVKDHENESCPNSVVVADFERALAVAGMLHKVITPDVNYLDFRINPLT